MTRDPESGRTDFISEAEEILEDISGGLQELQSSFSDQNIRPELINKLFRHFHSLKGISGMLGFERISSFTHELETLLDHVRLGKTQITQQTIEILDQALDVLHRLIREDNSASQQSFYPDGLIRKINSVMDRTATTARTKTFAGLQLDDQTLQSLTQYEEHRLSENLKEGKNLFSIQLALNAATFDSELREFMDTLSTSGEIISTLPWFDPNAGADTMLFRLIYGTFEPASVLPELLEKSDLDITDLKKAPAGPIAEEEAGTTAGSTLRALSDTVRVNIRKLDEVIHVIGELVILKNQVLQQSRDLMRTSEAAALDLSRAGIQLEKKLLELQRGVIETRLVPVGQIYNRLARMVRKLSRETGKTIDLRLYGSETELDKVMIEMVSDPLLHIIRNAIDHGIEPAQERKKLGKPATGLIKLSAFQRGNSVVIQVQDDGRGIDAQKIEAQAKKKGFIPQDRTLDRKECIDMLFSPGFSSSESVTALSGRGVGLDVVKKNISDLKGSIALYTEEGQGTLFEITLPITLAILQALLVRVANRPLAIPLTSVTEIVRVSKEEIQSVDQREILYLREKIVPLVRVADALGLKALEERHEFFAVIIPAGDQSFGLLVDELTGQQEIVIKSLGEKLKNIPGIAGAAEVGEKKPVLVIDAESMIAEITQGRVRAL